LRTFVGDDDAPRALILTGGPGIGKTTLWDAGVDTARECGARVLSARPSGATLIDLLAQRPGPAPVAPIAGEGVRPGTTTLVSRARARGEPSGCSVAGHPVGDPTSSRLSARKAWTETGQQTSSRCNTTKGWWRASSWASVAATADAR
jgi:hypothetical protein